MQFGSSIFYSAHLTLRGWLWNSDSETGDTCLVVAKMSLDIVPEIFNPKAPQATLLAGFEVQYLALYPLVIQQNATDGKSHFLNSKSANYFWTMAFSRFFVKLPEGNPTWLLKHLTKSRYFLYVRMKTMVSGCFR